MFSKNFRWSLIGKVEKHHLLISCIYRSQVNIILLFCEKDVEVTDVLVSQSLDQGICLQTKG